MLRWFILLLALASALPALAQERKKIEKAADLPRFTYKVDGKVEDLIRDDAKFRAFATEVRKNNESVLRDYEIADKATLKELLGTIVQLDMLEGRYDPALAGAARIRDLQEKPADKLMSGMTTRAIVAAQRKAGDRMSPAYRAEVGRAVAGDLAAMPYAVVANEVKEAKMRTELMGEGRYIGAIREMLQPTVDKNGVLSSDLAPTVVGLKYALTFALPLKEALTDAYAGYLAANRVDKPDIWAARDVVLPQGRGYTPVNVAVWDSGVDIALFKDRLIVDAAGKPASIAFDKYANPSSSDLFPIPADLRDKVPRMKARLKGFSDLQSNIDSTEASTVKQFLSTLKPDEYKAAVEELGAAGIYMHGTHVAGIALAGNPYARLMNARIEFGHTLLPDPCPTRELAEKDARNAQAYVDQFKRFGVRVVNMSWGGSVLGIEDDLEKCGIGKTPDERKAIAREYFEIQKNALAKAMARAPEILFVAAAGNENSDASFTESIPAAISLPNLMSVGAVDKAGDEASFTSYGPTVVVHANGYQVESVIPGGEKLATSGTSFSAPQVTNLAAKLVAVNPKLTPPELIRVIRDSAETTADGRRHLVNPKKAVAAAGS